MAVKRQNRCSGIRIGAGRRKSLATILRECAISCSMIPTRYCRRRV
jgi:hypothetical protein